MKLVPRTKLLIWLGIIFLPFSVLTAVMPATTVAGIGLAVVFLFVAVIDAVLSRNRLTGIHITMPEVVRLSVGHDSELTLVIENDDLKVKQLRLGLAFPREIFSPNQDLITYLAQETPSSLIAWPFKALKQGRYLLKNCYLETASMLGFWSLRRTQAARAEIRVYPDLSGNEKN